jgi:hypothetical protein
MCYNNRMFLRTVADSESLTRPDKGVGVEVGEWDVDRHRPDAELLGSLAVVAVSEVDPRAEIVGRIAGDPALTHGLHCTARSPQTSVYKLRPGSLDIWEPGRFSSRAAEAYDRTFWGSREVLRTSDGYMPAFQAVVVENKVDVPFNGSDPTRVSFALIYLDAEAATIGHPEGGVAQYTLLLPPGSEHVGAIEADPSLMIDLMQNVFPDTNRSGGALSLAHINS